MLALRAPGPTSNPKYQNKETLTEAFNNRGEIFSLHSKTRLLVPSVQESPVRTKGFFRQESRWEGISKPILKGTTKEETTRFIQMIGMNIIPKMYR